MTISCLFAALYCISPLSLCAFVERPRDQFEDECVAEDADSEDQYYRLYGSDRFEAGRWRRVRHFRDDTEKLKNIAIQAHKKAGLGDDDVIHSATFDHVYLVFDKDKLWFMHIRADSIIYSVEREPDYYFFITKGLKLGCVHYLKQAKPPFADKGAFNLGEHVCGITLPTLEPMLNFLDRS